MARDAHTHEYPPGEWTAEEIARSLRDAPAEFPLPTYADREAWERLAGDDLTAPAVEETLRRAEEARGEPVPRLPASRYLDYTRTGNRGRYQDPEGTRLSRLSAFAFAECVERDGEYLDDVLDYAWAVCEQSTWVLPAHLGDNERQARAGLPGAVPDEDRWVDLRAAGIARLLAELDHALGEQLHPALREHIRSEVDRRVFTPYEARDDFWWFSPPANNWNAVCNAGTVIAALYLLEDPERQARIVEKAVGNLGHYLDGFDDDGGTAEGVGYWNYGFGNYVRLAACLEARTAGEFSLLSPPIVREIARFPLKVEMSPGRFIPFSDTDEAGRVDPATACWLGSRLDLRGVAARGRNEFAASDPPARLGDAVRTLQWVSRVPEAWTVPTPPIRTRFTGHDWWVARADPADPEAAVVAAKGGDNNESHNHNDLGSFVLHYAGESLLTDPGRPVYDADYFSERRYEYLPARSLGHSVPHVNGSEQAAGEGFAATVLDSGTGAGDSFTVEVAGGYPGEAGLDSLTRTFTLDRSGGGRLHVEDDVRFEEPDSEFVEVLVSYFPMEATGDGVVVTGENGRATISLEPEPDDTTVERLGEAIKGDDVWRTRFTYGVDGRDTAVALTASPGPAEP